MVYDKITKKNSIYNKSPEYLICLNRDCSKKTRNVNLQKLLIVNGVQYNYLKEIRL